MKRNLWPWAIIAYFAVFITGVVTWVVFAVHHEDQLVRPDYYEHEIRYQEQIDRVARTAALSEKVLVAYHPADQTISIGLPSFQGEGVVHLYRPSDATLDQQIKLAVDEHGSQTINVAGLQAGLWKVHLTWSAAGKEYYFDKPVILGSN